MAENIKPKADVGLWVDRLPVETFIKVNDLKECTDPIFIDKNTFTPGGVLSNEIFGITQNERKSRFAYIDLGPYHYMMPLAAMKLSAYDRTLGNILASRGLYKLKSDGTLVADDKGDTGPEFLYKIWGKVKVKDKETVATKEIQTYFEKPRELLFITKYPVIPAFYRDVNPSAGNGTKGTNIINSIYSNIIAHTQSMKQYTTSFGNTTQLTQARVQMLLVEIYEQLMVKTVKGTPSKYGMQKRAFTSKTVSYTVRSVITAPDLNAESVDRVQCKYGHVTIPLDQVCSLFMPFMIHHLKAFFDAEFIHSGKRQYLNKKGEMETGTFVDSFDENYITLLIKKFINSPSTRFEVMKTPPMDNGLVGNMVLTGRFNKSNTTFTRAATVTDILYIVAERVVADKHVIVTRYPLDNPNGQWPGKVMISTTLKTEPVMIGNTVYDFFPIIKGDPNNAFYSTTQFSNIMLLPMGGDYDGDMISIRAEYTKEANAEAAARIDSNSFMMSSTGDLMHKMEKDFIITMTCLTRSSDIELKPANKVAPKYDV